MEADIQAEQTRDQMNIYQRLNEVRKEVTYVQKDKKVGEGGYLAVTHDAVTALARDSFIKHGIVIVPNLLTSQSVLTGTETAKGAPYIRYEARYRFDVVNIEEPSDKFPVEIESHAMDYGDKAPGKALSYAKKYVVLKLLEIESGEGEEDRSDQRPSKPAKVTPNAGAGDELTAKEKQVVMDTFVLIKDAFQENREWDAYQAYCSITENDQKLYLWSQLGPKERASIKRMGEAERKGDAPKP